MLGAYAHPSQRKNSIDVDAPFRMPRFSAVCNQPALEVSWSNAVLSFSVTEGDLATGSIHIELCGEGIRAQDLIASGVISGDVTLQLIGRLRTRSLEKKEYSAEERDGSVGSSRTEPAAIGGKAAIGVRLFATAGGGDVGVCTLNLKIIPDGDDDEPAREAIKNAHQPGTPAEAMRQENLGTSAPSSASLVAAVSSVIPDTAATMAAEVKTAAAVAEAAVAAPNGEERERHLLLLEEAARHIETIEEVQVPRTHVGCGLPPNI